MEDEKIIVRLVHGKKDGKWWFEEKLGEKWVKIESTHMSCEGNAISNMRQVIHERKIEKYKDYTEVKYEKEYII